MLRIEIDEGLRKHIRSLNVEERRLIGLAINQAASAWGRPHLHAGSGIRKLNRAFYECRFGLRTRLVFKEIDGNTLHFILIGTHDEIHRFLKRHG